MMHEIITLQFGQQANYLGTHYWNTQESYFTYAGQEESPVDHDISFRPGIGADGSDTYTPRTLIYDLKGAFGTLQRENALYGLQHQENPAQRGPWSGSTIPLQLPPIAPSPYQQALDRGTAPPELTTETVRFWSDYNHIFYHPRSIVQLNEYELNSSLMPFERWQTGEELFANLDREHDLLDRDLRPFLEECDQLQGIQIFAGIDDAWGGFTARYLERISDDLGKGCRWVCGLTDGKRVARDQQLFRLGNLAQSIHSIDTSASVHIPLTSTSTSSPSYITLDASSPWHTTALECAVIESITLPTRLRNSESAHASFDELETTLNNEGNRRMVAAELSVDDPAHMQDRLRNSEQHDTRMTNGFLDYEDAENRVMKLDLSLFPDMAGTMASEGRRLGRRTHTFSRIESLRGPWTPDDANQDSIANSYEHRPGGLRSSSHISQLLFPLLSSCPHVFQFPSHPDKVAIRTAISTSTAVADQIRQLERSARRIVGIDEREALCDSLSHMAEEYEEGWSDIDESDDND